MKLTKFSLTIRRSRGRKDITINNASHKANQLQNSNKIKCSHGINSIHTQKGYVKWL